MTTNKTPTKTTPPIPKPIVADPIKSHNRLGIRLLAYLIVILILIGGAVFGTYLYEHHQSTKTEDADQTQIKSLNLKVAALNKELRTKDNQSAQTSNSSSSQKYLDISQLGIKLPLNSTLADLSYTWHTSSSYAPYAILYSKSLANYEVQTAPECSSSVNLSQGEMLVTIAINNKLDPAYTTVTIGKQTCMMQFPQFSYGCQTLTGQQDSSINSKLQEYKVAITSAFKAASPLN